MLIKSPSVPQLVQPPNSMDHKLGASFRWSFDPLSRVPNTYALTLKLVELILRCQIQSLLATKPFIGEALKKGTSTKQILGDSEPCRFPHGAVYSQRPFLPRTLVY